MEAMEETDEKKKKKRPKFLYTSFSFINSLQLYTFWGEWRDMEWSGQICIKILLYMTWQKAYPAQGLNILELNKAITEWVDAAGN